MANSKANSAKYLEGSDLMVFVGGKSIAGAKTCSIEVTANLTSTSTKTKDEIGGGW